MQDNKLKYEKPSRLKSGTPGTAPGKSKKNKLKTTARKTNKSKETQRFIRKWRIDIKGRILIHKKRLLNHINTKSCVLNKQSLKSQIIISQIEKIQHDPLILFQGMSEYERIRRACLKRGELWEDPDFPATQASVFYHQTPPFQFTWKRPKVSLACRYKNK